MPFASVYVTWDYRSVRATELHERKPISSRHGENDTACVIIIYNIYNIPYFISHCIGQEAILAEAGVIDGLFVVGITEL